MSKGIAAALLLIASLLSAMPLASAYSYCPNATYSVHDDSVLIAGAILPVVSYEPCTHNCSAMTGTCMLSSGWGMPYNIYLLFFFIAAGALVYSIYSKHWFPALVAMLMFGVLGFLGFNLEVVTDGGTIQAYGPSGIFITLSQMLCGFSLLVLLIGMVYIFKDIDKPNKIKVMP